jgi:hemerythrin-like domain-containing protein
LFEGPIDDRPDDEEYAPKHLPETYEMVAEWRKIMDEESKERQQTKYWKIILRHDKI